MKHWEKLRESNRNFKEHPIIYLWGRVMYHFGNFHAKLSEPLVFAPLTLNLATYLTVRGIHFGDMELVLSFILVGVGGVMIGKRMESSGWLEVSASITNKNNPELMETLKIVKEINEKMK